MSEPLIKLSRLLPVLACAILLAACGAQTAPPAEPPASLPTALALTLTPTLSPSVTALPSETASPAPSPTTAPFPMTIAAMRAGNYPGSDLVIEEELPAGANYRRYIASYKSEGLKIRGLLTVPNGDKPASGWPVIIFNHGYIPPKEYHTTERYVAYVDLIARAGYIVFKPDLRGHDQSEGDARGAYAYPDYVIDDLNAVASLKRYPDADPNRIGMWGHSMGGYITLRVMVISKDIKAGVIWGGVVGSYPDMLNNWKRGPSSPAIPRSNQSSWRSWAQTYGMPDQNPDFWASISATSYLADISGPLQLDHATTDEEVPLAFSEALFTQLLADGKYVELYKYEGDNHNISKYFNLAMGRSIEFFDKWVKNAPPEG